jgi:photosystem II stability/assembly factor-like uncharacterized protein
LDPPGWLDKIIDDTMTSLLLLATSDGLVACRRDGESWQEVRRGLDDQGLTSVIAREGVILAGAETGLYRSDDLGETWRESGAGLAIPYVRWLAYHPHISDREFAGTEPAGIFVSHDGAGHWRACPEVAALREAGRWFLPYSPEAGCVRGFAFHGSRGYAAVEVGGVLVSDDAGETWRLAEGSTGKGTVYVPRSPFVASDVHSVEAHPSSPDLVFAATHNGLYRSNDGGKTWANLYECYCRAVWVDPADPGHIVLGPAETVDSGGRIEETRDAGQTWALLPTESPTPWPDHMVERFAPFADGLLAVLSNGELLAASQNTPTWNRILPHVENINAVAVMEL